MRGSTREVNFDGIVGATHNYAGLSWGNVASERNRGAVSRPRAAALEGIAKMRTMLEMGVMQAVLPPQERPALATLRRLGFSGSDSAVIERAAKDAPGLLAMCSSASAMWAANAATVSPGADTADGRIHFTVANLSGEFHRSLEAGTTARVLRAIFGDEKHFALHEPLPGGAGFGDEGAANWVRLAPSHAAAGIELLVYGRSGADARGAGPAAYPARQTREASAAVARLHGLGERALLLRQNAAAIDAGVFHNDVIAVGNENVLLAHAAAFSDRAGALSEIQGTYARQASGGRELVVVEVSQEELTVAEAVRAYLFNSQLVTLADGTMCLVAPAECAEDARAFAVIERIKGQTPIRQVRFVDVRQSMRNGGGPACLRLRVAMDDAQLAAMHGGVMADEALLAKLEEWVRRHYREELRAEDLADPKLLVEVRDGLEALCGILGLRGIYGFQG